MHRTRTAAATALAVALAVLPLTGMAGPPGGGGKAGQDGPRDSPGVAGSRALSPTPRSVRSRSDQVTITRSVTVVAGPDTDAPALAVVEKSLKDAGADRVVRAERDPGDGQLAVYVGGAGASRALRALGARGPDGLPAEGYALAVGGGRIALSGKDATGTYYAAQSLRQLLPTGSGRARGCGAPPYATGRPPRCEVSSRASTEPLGRMRPGSTSSTSTASTR